MNNICPTTKEECKQHPLQCNTTCWLTQPHNECFVTTDTKDQSGGTETDIWYPVEYAGYYNIQTTPYYDTGINVLNAEECDRAEINAALCAAAPELLTALLILVGQLKYEGKWRNAIELAKCAIAKATTIGRISDEEKLKSISTHAAETFKNSPRELADLTDEECLQVADLVNWFPDASKNLRISYIKGNLNKYEHVSNLFTGGQWFKLFTYLQSINIKL